MAAKLDCQAKKDAITCVAKRKLDPRTYLRDWVRAVVFHYCHVSETVDPTFNGARKPLSHSLTFKYYLLWKRAFGNET